MNSISAASHTVQSQAFPDRGRIRQSAMLISQRSADEWRSIIQRMFRIIADLEGIRVKDLFSTPLGIMRQEYYSRLLHGRVVSVPGYRRLENALIYYGMKYPEIQDEIHEALAALFLLARHLWARKTYWRGDEQRYMDHINEILGVGFPEES